MKTSVAALLAARMKRQECLGKTKKEAEEIKGVIPLLKRACLAVTWRWAQRREKKQWNKVRRAERTRLLFSWPPLWKKRSYPRESSDAVRYYVRLHDTARGRCWRPLFARRLSETKRGLVAGLESARSSPCGRLIFLVFRRRPETPVTTRPGDAYLGRTDGRPDSRSDSIVAGETWHADKRPLCSLRPVNLPPIAMATSQQVPNVNDIVRRF